MSNDHDRRARLRALLSWQGMVWVLVLVGRVRQHCVLSIQTVNRQLHYPLRLKVQRGRRLIENKNGRAPYKHSG
eukprot:scaffold223941_cov37-Tisochrysis_lutea.AAC.3